MSVSSFSRMFAIFRAFKSQAVFVIFACASLLATTTHALPTVSGLTISWPDDGYYQVQDSTTYQSVCEGTRECTVSAGTYIVINHTTAQRFEGIVVNGESTGSDSLGFRIEGNTIVFTQDDWFQVQDSTTYASLCNGASTCELESGIYIVINHDTGERIGDVVVGMPNSGETPLEPAEPPVVTGNTISWANDGWYQVQNSSDFTSVCEGGQSCDVADGTYNVINLTTRQRFENVVVDAGGSTPLENPGAETSEQYPAILTQSDATLTVPANNQESQLHENARDIGDVNGDGLDDIVVVVPGEQSWQTSAAILFADAADSYSDLQLVSGLSSSEDVLLSNGFFIDDVSPSINGVGDVNGDGLADLSLQASGFFELARRVVLAGSSSFPARLSTDNLPGTQLLVQLPISGSLISAGDINGDGLGDMFVAGPSDVAGGVIYGNTALNTVVSTRDELRDMSLFPGCGRDFCSTLPIGDFDGDGFDDVYVSRFGANNCGFSSYTAVIYGGPLGIEKADSVISYPDEIVTRIVGERGGDCYPQAVAAPYASGDVDGDGAIDLILGTSFPDSRFLLFGSGDRRRAFLSIDELDGQRGVSIPGRPDLELADVNSDGFGDVIFPNGKAFAGSRRDISSIDNPVVVRTPSTFVIRLSDSVLAMASRFSIAVNSAPVGTFDSGNTDVEIVDLTAGAQATIDIALLSESDELIKTLRRVVPAFADSENLMATLLAPRLVELTFNSRDAIRRYGNYLVWRNGAPIGRSLGGADNYIDQDVELGTTYQYYVTPDYLYDESLDAESLNVGPLLQRQSNSVVVTTPVR